MAAVRPLVAGWAMVAVACTSSVALADADAEPAFGVLNRMAGKTYASEGERVFVNASRKIVYIDVKNGWPFMVSMRGGLPVGIIQNAMLQLRAELRIGADGIAVRHPLKKTLDYFILDRAGDLNHIKIAEEGGTPRFVSYAKLIDQSQPDAKARTDAASALRTTDAAVAARVVGYQPDEAGMYLDPAPDQSPAPVTASAATFVPVPARLDAGSGRRANAGPRLALVVGNGRYGAALGTLANAANDAHAISATLQTAGFQVTEVTDADQKAMKRAIIAFGQRLTAAGRGTTGLFYYAGHGIQSRGTNFLVPVGAAIESEADVDVEAVAADTVLRQMEEAGASTSIVILDACRNLPVQRAFRDGTRGLARMEAPNGSFVAYSTAPGSVAADGSGANSPFAAALVAEMKKPGQPIEITFRNVRRAVMAATVGKQTPWDSSSLVDSFVFTGE